MELHKNGKGRPGGLPYNSQINQNYRLMKNREVS